MGQERACFAGKAATGGVVCGWLAPLVLPICRPQHFSPPGWDWGVEVKDSESQAGELGVYFVG